MGQPGRPRKDIDLKELEDLASIQCTTLELAAWFGCDSSLFSKPHYSEIVKKGRERGKLSLRRKMFQTAMGGNVTMQIWLSKQYFGFSDKQEVTQDTTLEVKASGEEIVNAVKISLERGREPSPNPPIPV